MSQTGSFPQKIGVFDIKKCLNQKPPPRIGGISLQTYLQQSPRYIHWHKLLCFRMRIFCRQQKNRYPQVPRCPQQHPSVHELPKPAQLLGHRNLLLLSMGNKPANYSGGMSNHYEMPQWGLSNHYEMPQWGLSNHYEMPQWGLSNHYEMPQWGLSNHYET